VDRLLLSIGGATRTESVRNGLEDLPDEASIALVHDAARPLIDDAVIERVVAGARGGACVVPALPVVDTIKEVDENGRVARTPERARLRRVQTPQGFPRAILERVYRESKGVSATDDASLCERLGIPVTTVEGSERALKVTDELDFARVESLFAGR
jgi:2-C-methyl-D-erythritol 4-phosphate cytidylyltransferase